jgi:hypothetical protein
LKEICGDLMNPEEIYIGEITYFGNLNFLFMISRRWKQAFYV